MSAVSAPHFVGSAGEGLEELSTIESLLPLQQQLIKGAGRDLRTFRRRTYGGWVLGLGGGVITIVGLKGADERLTIGGVATFAAGYIMSNLIAPWSIGSAGKKLEEAGNPATEEGPQLGVR